MSQANLLTVFVFLIFVLLGLAAQTLLQLLKQRRSRRMVERFRETMAGTADTTRKQVLADLQRAQADARRRRRRQSMGTVGYYLNRLETVSGAKGLPLLIGVGAGSFIALLFGFWSGMLPNSLPIVMLSLIILPLWAMWLTYRQLLDRFNKRFLAQLPEAIDLIVRASQAGVPAGHSIRTVGERYDPPLGPEFRRMGDALLLGNDMEEVLDDAALRIEMPDFSFFAVCLLLQRETGGSLAETLENLSGIIRARRDLGLKTKALTAEGRFAGALLSALPFLIIGALMLVNPDYIEVMFKHPTGQLLLWVAAGMLTVGILLIRKIARLEV